MDVGDHIFVASRNVGDLDRSRNRHGNYAGDDDRSRNRDGNVAGHHDRSRNRDGNVAGHHDRSRNRDGNYAGDDDRSRNRDGNVAGHHDRLRNRDGNYAGDDDRSRNRDGNVAGHHDRWRSRDGNVVGNSMPSTSCGLNTSMPSAHHSNISEVRLQPTDAFLAMGLNLPDQIDPGGFHPNRDQFNSDPDYPGYQSCARTVPFRGRNRDQSNARTIPFRDRNRDQSNARTIPDRNWNQRIFEIDLDGGDYEDVADEEIDYDDISLRIENPNSWQRVEDTDSWQRVEDPNSWQRAEDPNSWQGVEDPNSWQRVEDPNSWQGVEDPNSWQSVEDPNSWQRVDDPNIWQGVEDPNGWQRVEDPNGWQRVEDPNSWQRVDSNSWQRVEEPNSWQGVGDPNSWQRVDTNTWQRVEGNDSDSDQEYENQNQFLDFDGPPEQYPGFIGLEQLGNSEVVQQMIEHLQGEDEKRRLFDLLADTIDPSIAFEQLSIMFERNPFKKRKSTRITPEANIVSGDDGWTDDNDDDDDEWTTDEEEEITGEIVESSEEENDVNPQSNEDINMVEPCNSVRSAESNQPTNTDRANEQILINQAPLNEFNQEQEVSTEINIQSNEPDIMILNQLERMNESSNLTEKDEYVEINVQSSEAHDVKVPSYMQEINTGESNWINNAAVLNETSNISAEVNQPTDTLFHSNLWNEIMWDVQLNKQHGGTKTQTCDINGPESLVTSLLDQRDIQEWNKIMWDVQFNKLHVIKTHTCDINSESLVTSLVDERDFEDLCDNTDTSKELNKSLVIDDSSGTVAASPAFSAEGPRLGSRFANQPTERDPEAEMTLQLNKLEANIKEMSNMIDISKELTVDSDQKPQSTTDIVQPIEHDIDEHVNYFILRSMGLNESVIYQSVGPVQLNLQSNERANIGSTRNLVNQFEGLNESNQATSTSVNNMFEDLINSPGNESSNLTESDRSSNLSSNYVSPTFVYLQACIKQANHLVSQSSSLIQSYYAKRAINPSQADESPTIEQLQDSIAQAIDFINHTSDLIDPSVADSLQEVVEQAITVVDEAVLNRPNQSLDNKKTDQNWQHITPQEPGVNVRKLIEKHEKQSREFSENYDHYCHHLEPEEMMDLDEFDVLAPMPCIRFFQRQITDVVNYIRMSTDFIHPFLNPQDDTFETDPVLRARMERAMELMNQARELLSPFVGVNPSRQDVFSRLKQRSNMYTILSNVELLQIRLARASDLLDETTELIQPFLQTPSPDPDIDNQYNEVRSFLESTMGSLDQMVADFDRLDAERARREGLEPQPIRRTIQMRQQPMLPCQQPIQTPQHPIQTRQQPIQSGQQPIQLGQQPVQQHQQPMPQRQQPMRLYQQPIQTRQQPIHPRQQPIQTRQQPIQTWQQPIQTRQQPLRQRQQPIQSRQQPKIQRQKLIKTRQQPIQSLQQPINPTEQPAEAQKSTLRHGKPSSPRDQTMQTIQLRQHPTESQRPPPNFRLPLDPPYEHYLPPNLNADFFLEDDLEDVKAMIADKMVSNDLVAEDIQRWESEFNRGKSNDEAIGPQDGQNQLGNEIGKPVELQSVESRQQSIETRQVTEVIQRSLESRQSLESGQQSVELQQQQTNIEPDDPGVRNEEAESVQEANIHPTTVPDYIANHPEFQPKPAHMNLNYIPDPELMPWWSKPIFRGPTMSFEHGPQLIYLPNLILRSYRQDRQRDVEPSQNVGLSYILEQLSGNSVPSQNVRRSKENFEDTEDLSQNTDGQSENVERHTQDPERRINPDISSPVMSFFLNLPLNSCLHNTLQLMRIYLDNPENNRSDFQAFMRYVEEQNAPRSRILDMQISIPEHRIRRNRLIELQNAINGLRIERPIYDIRIDLARLLQFRRTEARNERNIRQYSRILDSQGEETQFERTHFFRRPDEPNNITHNIFQPWMVVLPSRMTTDSFNPEEFEGTGPMIFDMGTDQFYSVFNQRLMDTIIRNPTVLIDVLRNIQARERRGDFNQSRK